MSKEVLKENLLYLFDKGIVKWMKIKTLLVNKEDEELSYVKFLLERRAKVREEWIIYLKIWLNAIEGRIKNLYQPKKG